MEVPQVLTIILFLCIERYYWRHMHELLNIHELLITETEKTFLLSFKNFIVSFDSTKNVSKLVYVVLVLLLLPRVYKKSYILEEISISLKMFTLKKHFWVRVSIL